MATAAKLTPVAKAEQPVGLALLRAEFPPNQISKLPKETKKQAEERKAGNNIEWKCGVCGGMHHKNAVHLDYVGHAALTDRLLDADPEWSWEPLAYRDGLPAFDQTGGLWIKLTVCGVTRLGYGHAAPKPQMDAGSREKEVIGDALRNAAMRFGAALDLWHKGDLHAEPEASDDTEAGDGSTLKQQLQESVKQEGAKTRDKPFPPGPARNSTDCKEKCRALWRDVEACEDSDQLGALLASSKDLMEQIERGIPTFWAGGTDRHGEAFEGLSHVIERRRSDLEGLAQSTGDWRDNPIIGG